MQCWVPHFSTAVNVNPIRGGGGGFSAPLRFFLYHCQTPQHRKLILGDFFQTFIAHMSSQLRVGSQAAVLCLAAALRPLAVRSLESAERGTTVRPVSLPFAS